MYKLNRIEDTDVFYFAAANRDCLGDTIAQGSFADVLNVANQLKQTAADIGSGGSVQVTDGTALTNIIDAKWYVIFLDTDLVQIIRTDGETVYSLPTGFECYQEPLTDIFNRLIQKYN